MAQEHTSNIIPGSCVAMPHCFRWHRCSGFSFRGFAKLLKDQNIVFSLLIPNNSSDTSWLNKVTQPFCQCHSPRNSDLFQKIITKAWNSFWFFYLSHVDLLDVGFVKHKNTTTKVLLPAQVFVKNTENVDFNL